MQSSDVWSERIHLETEIDELIERLWDISRDHLLDPTLSDQEVSQRKHMIMDIMTRTIEEIAVIDYFLAMSDPDIIH